MLGVVCARGAVCGANQPSCGDEFASIALAASPYDCQAKVAPIPMENMIRKRHARLTRGSSVVVGLSALLLKVMETLKATEAPLPGSVCAPAQRAPLVEFPRASAELPGASAELPRASAELP